MRIIIVTLALTFASARGVDVDDETRVCDASACMKLWTHDSGYRLLDDADCQTPAPTRRRESSIGLSRRRRALIRRRARRPFDRGTVIADLRKIGEPSPRRGRESPRGRFPSRLRRRELVATASPHDRLTPPPRRRRPRRLRVRHGRRVQKRLSVQRATRRLRPAKKRVRVAPDVLYALRARGQEVRQLRVGGVAGAAASPRPPGRSSQVPQGGAGLWTTRELLVELAMGRHGRSSFGARDPPGLSSDLLRAVQKEQRPLGAARRERRRLGPRPRNGRRRVESRGPRGGPGPRRRCRR
mmetsp:Transcript_22550/g.70679  ORF Transcript_22550/g.70679 Transcript_22550/m.70679 type:complete len:298 (+) Transcript_22550:243-1136(+)